MLLSALLTSISTFWLILVSTLCIVENFLPAVLLREFLGRGERNPPEVFRVLRVSRDPKNCLIVEASTLPRGSYRHRVRSDRQNYFTALLTNSIGLGVPGLSVLSDLESPTLSEKLPDLFLAAFMGTLRELLLDSKEDILSFTGGGWWA